MWDKITEDPFNRRQQFDLRVMLRVLKLDPMTYLVRTGVFDYDCRTDSIYSEDISNPLHTFICRMFSFS